MKYYVLYHSMSGQKGGQAATDGLLNYFKKEELEYRNVMDIDDYEAFFNGLEGEDAVIVTGGDGSINQFVNRTEGISYSNAIYYFATGTGNDFLRDIGGKVGDAPIRLEQYIQNLPVVTVNDKNYRYLNGVGYGIDGYCCEVGDELKAKSDKPVNYTGIAIKGLLFHYKPCNAVITVDGKKYDFKKVWLAPTMNGKYYGGGMMAAPEQNRLNDKKTQSVMLFYGKGKILTLMAFPKIFEGKHVEKKNMVQILTGNKITVEFAEPRALQIDGETIKNVKKYEINA